MHRNSMLTSGREASAQFEAVKSGVAFDWSHHITGGQTRKGERFFNRR